MDNTEKIVHMLRVDPNADIGALVEDDASIVTAQVVGTTHIRLIRAAIIAFVHKVHRASALVVAKQERKLVTARLDAAEDRALLHAANRRIRTGAKLVKSLDSAESLDAIRDQLLEVLTPVTRPRRQQDQQR